MTGTRAPIPDDIFEQASDWAFRMQGAMGKAPPQSELDAWLAADSRHADAWKLACQTWALTGKATPAFTVASPPASALPVRRKLPRRRVTAMALAACVAALALLPSLQMRLRADHVTRTGESSAVQLQDGSRVTLSGGTAFSSRFSSDGRAVSLLQGEAFFQVAHDSARPFVVTGDGVSVTVTGTAFEVALDGGTVSVSVAEGSVAVDYQGETVHLAPGQGVTVDPASGETSHHAIAPADVAAWRQGQLVAGNERLAAVVDAIRRQYSGIIVLTDSALGSNHVTGVYDLNDPERALRALVGPYGGTVRQLTPFVLVVSPS